MLSILRQLHRRLRFRRLHKPDLKRRFRMLGTDYGGWPVIPELLPAAPLVYSFGTGEDISFDLAMIEGYGAQVHAFDPTPRAGAWIERQSLPDAFHFHAIGIAARDGTAAFYPPAGDGHVSFSSAPAADQAGTPVHAPVRRLESIMADLGHGSIDVLKMDIEGFEYAVIADVLASPARPLFLLVEFHHGMYQAGDGDTRGAVAALRADGYGLFHVSATGHEYGFVRLDRPPATASVA